MRQSAVYVHFAEDTFACLADFVERHSVAAIGRAARTRAGVWRDRSLTLVWRAAYSPPNGNQDREQPGRGHR